MAYIRERGGKYFAEIRRKGYPNQNKTFQTKAAARAWARRVETNMDDGSWIDARETRSVLIDNLVDDYILSWERFGIEVAGPKLSQLNMLSNWFEGVSLHELTVDGVLDFAAHRRKTVSASTLQKQMYALKEVVDHSRIKTEEPVVTWALNELIKKKIIMSAVKRRRRLADDEYEALMKEAGDHWIGIAIDLALTTGMRQGELHRFKWSDIDQKNNVIHLWRKDKRAEGGRRKAEIPLLEGVRETLQLAQNMIGQGPKPVPVKHAASISDKFARMTRQIGIEDLRFHDLRHEALTRLYLQGLDLVKIQAVSGHASLDQLADYINVRALDLVES